MDKAYTMLWNFLTRGFSATLDPMDVLRYSPPAFCNFAKVQLHGVVEWCGPALRWSRMQLVKSLSPYELVEAAVRDRGGESIETNSKPYGIAATNAEQSSAQTKGDCGVAFSRGRGSASTNVGDYGAAANTGSGGAATNTGENGIAVNASLCGGALNTGWRGLAVNDASFGMAASTGPYALSVNTAPQGVALSTYERTSASNEAADGIAASFGTSSRARSADGGIIIVAWWDETAKRKRVSVGYVGESGIEADAWYTASSSGALMNAQTTSRTKSEHVRENSAHSETDSPARPWRESFMSL